MSLLFPKTPRLDPTTRRYIQVRWMKQTPPPFPINRHFSLHLKPKMELSIQWHSPHTAFGSNLPGSYLSFSTWAGMDGWTDGFLAYLLAGWLMMVGVSWLGLGVGYHGWWW